MNDRQGSSWWQAAGSAAFVLATLGGCAEPLPEPVAPEAAITPALSAEQNERILHAVNAVVERADAARNPAVLSERLTGPALYVRTSQLEVADIRDDDELVTELPDTYQQLIVPTTEGWPRTMYAITDVGEGLAPPRLLALEQASARDPYKLWGWVQLRPGVSMPAFADPRVGTAELSEDDTSLRFTPREVAEQYADLLTNGDESPYVANFEPAADDPFRAFLTTWIAAQEQALAGDRVEGTYTFRAELLPDTEIKAVRTVTLDGEDNGAMVMFALTSYETLEAMEGAILTPQTKTAQALLEGEDFTNVLTATYTDMIALFVPPADSTDPVILLGNAHVQTAASVELPAEEEGEGDEAAEGEGDEAAEGEAAEAETPAEEAATN